MKAKLDENVTVAAKALFEAAGHQADSVTDEGLTGTADEPLLEICGREGRLLVIFDVGFGDIRAHPPGTHPGVMLLRLSDQQPAAVLNVLERLLDAHKIERLAGTLTVVTEDRVRTYPSRVGGPLSTMALTDPRLGPGPSSAPDPRYL